MKKAALRLVRQFPIGSSGRLSSGKALSIHGSARLTVSAPLKGNTGDVYQHKASQSGHLIRRSFSTASRDFGSKSNSEFHFESSLDNLFDPSAPCMIFGEEKPIPKPPTKLLKCGIPENMLRYKTTHFEKTIKAPYVHTCEHRIYVLVDLDLLPLDEVGHEILKQVAGHNRYDLRKKELRLQCNHFPSRIENKRYVVDTLDKLILACQRVAKDVSKVEG